MTDTGDERKDVDRLFGIDKDDETRMWPRASRIPNLLFRSPIGYSAFLDLACGGMLGV